VPYQQNLCFNNASKKSNPFFAVYPSAAEESSTEETQWENSIIIKSSKELTNDEPALQSRKFQAPPVEQHL
jgi:hypothetical protein